MITKKYLDALAASKFDLFKSKDIFKDNLEGLKKEIVSDLDQLAQLSLPEVYTERFDFFKLSGTIAEDFQERILEVENEKFIVAGIRFRGLNVNKPFVSIIANFEITSDKLSDLAKLIKKNFSIFKPFAFQFHLPSEVELIAPDLGIDRYTIAGAIEDLIDYKLPERPETVEIVELNNTDFYDEYIAEYTIFHKKNHELRDEVKPESLEVFKEAINNHLLYKVIIENEYAGIIAGAVSDYYGIHGVCIIEEILYDSFKGKGFGVYLQKEFAKKLQDRHQLLWGTISSLNHSSLKTAFRNGRKVEEVEYSYKL